MKPSVIKCSIKYMMELQVLYDGTSEVIILVQCVGFKQDFKIVN